VHEHIFSKYQPYAATMWCFNAGGRLCTVAWGCKFESELELEVHLDRLSVPWARDSSGKTLFAWTTSGSHAQFLAALTTENGTVADTIKAWRSARLASGLFCPQGSAPDLLPTCSNIQCMSSWKWNERSSSISSKTK